MAFGLRLPDPMCKLGWAKAEILKPCGPTSSFPSVSSHMRLVSAELLSQWGCTMLLLMPPGSGFRATLSLHYLEEVECI